MYTLDITMSERVGTANVMVFEKVPIATKVNISLPPDLEHSKR